MGTNDTSNHRKARAFINAKVKARSMAHPNTLPCVDCGHIWAKGERRHEYDHTHDYDDQTTWHLVESVCTTCHHKRTERREGVQAAVELNVAERAGGVTGKGFQPGVSGNPGGQSKEKRAFLERLRAEDADKIYDATMDLVKLRNPLIVKMCVEYIAGKATEKVELTGKDGGPLKSEVEHDIKAEVVQSVEWQRQVLALAIRTGVITPDGQLVDSEKPA